MSERDAHLSDDVIHHPHLSDDVTGHPHLSDDVVAVVLTHLSDDVREGHSPER